MRKLPTVTIVFDRKRRATSKTPGAVEIAVYYNKKQYRVYTGISVYSDEWANELVAFRRDCVSLNRHIAKAKADIFAYALKAANEGLEELDTDYLKQLATAKAPKVDQSRREEIKAVMAETSAPASKDEVRISTSDFCDWLDKRIETRDDIEESTKRQHRCMARSVRESCLFKTFADLTTANIKLWDDMLHNKYKQQTTIHGYHKRLKPYINEAVAYGFLSRSPYLPIKIKRGSSMSKKFLREAERDAIENLPLTGGHAKARDMFIFSCYTGLAYSDMVKIKKEDIVRNGDRLEIIDRRQKTGSQYRIILLPKAKAILEKYNYNLNLLTNQKCNEYLKYIAFAVGVKINLTMHVGRHTFATWCLRRGIRIEVVSKMLAHADITTTQIYAKILQEDVESGYEQLMGT